MIRVGRVVVIFDGSARPFHSGGIIKRALFRQIANVNDVGDVGVAPAIRRGIAGIVVAGYRMRSQVISMRASNECTRGSGAVVIFISVSLIVVEVVSKGLLRHLISV